MGNVRYEEGTEIVLDTEAEAPAAGWTFGYASLNRVGALVALHIETTFLLGAASLVCTLPADLAPGATVTTADGKFTIHADGTVDYTGSTAGPGAATLEAVYQAGQLSP